MTKQKVFVTRKIPEKGIALIRDFCEVDVWQNELPPVRRELLDRTKDVDGLLSALTERVDA
jgi:glyoxylate reductase